MAWPRASTLTILVASLPLLAGCGSTQTVGSTRTLQVALTEYRMNPPKVRVSQGYLTIFVHNYGRLTHNLVVSRGGHSTAFTKPIWPGGAAALTVYVYPGRYSLGSTLLSDEALGLDGSLTVTR